MSLIKGILKNNNLKEIEVKLKGKFYKDEVFYEDEARCIYFEGVVLNLKELLKKYEKKNLSDLIIYLYTKEKGEFFSYFKGNFCGIYHDKEIKKTLVFTDQHGNKPVFYFSKDDGNEFFFSDNVKEIINIMKAKSYKVSLNLAGVYSLLTYGYMYSNNTLFDYVFRLLPGTYIIFENNQFEVISYYKVNNSQILAVSEDEAIIQLDKLFLEATKLQADKNKEYGFDNYTPLSAGLDSRMTAYALNRLGVENVINFT